MIYFQLLPYPFLDRGQGHLGTIKKYVHLLIEKNTIFALPNP